jgi:hypothetical protein
VTRPCTISSTPASLGPRLAGYSPSPDFAWSGWRLRLPGGPEGGQYHGFIGPDSDYGWGTENGSEIAGAPDAHAYVEPGNPFLGDLPREPWSNEWGGTPLAEGETVSDSVYRSPGEMRPRANANGGALTVYGYQTRRSAGFAESPGNLGPPGGSYHRACPPPAHNRTLGAGFTVRTPNPAPRGGPARYLPIGPGATSTVPQPGAPGTPAVWGGRPPGYVTIAPNTNVNPVTGVANPTSPAPSPTVSVGPASLLPSNGLSLADQPATVAASPNPVMPQTPGALWLPQTSYPYGSIITDSNGNLQMAVQAGVTGEIQPVWPLVPGSITTDGGYGTAVAWELYSGSNNNPGVMQQNAIMSALQAQQTAALPAIAATATAAVDPTQPLASIANFEAWLQTSTIYAGAPNWAIVGGGALAVWYFFFRKKH